jgi:uncharacterized protein DUF3168
VSGVIEAVQAALAARLAATPAVTNALGDPLRLFEARNRRAAFPHASWGGSEVSERGADGARMLEIRLTLDIWQRDASPAALLGVLSDSVAAAPVPDLPAPWRLISLTPAYRDVFATPERRLKRGLLRVRALVACACV